MRRESPAANAPICGVAQNMVDIDTYRPVREVIYTELRHIVERLVRQGRKVTEPRRYLVGKPAQIPIQHTVLPFIAAEAAVDRFVALSVESV